MSGKPMSPPPLDPEGKEDSGDSPRFRRVMKRTGVSKGGSRQSNPAPRQMLKRTAVTVLFVLLACCSVPGEKRVSHDFFEVFSKEGGKGVRPLIVSVGPGEGNSESVYEHVKFEVIADESTRIKEGWFLGSSIEKGERLRDNELVMLYEKKEGQWRLTWCALAKKNGVPLVNRKMD